MSDTTNNISFMFGNDFMYLYSVYNLENGFELSGIKLVGTLIPIHLLNTNSENK